MKEQELGEVVVQEEVQEESKLIIYNDEVNDYSSVVSLLETICDLDLLRAEQCTLIAHNSGKCIVKKGIKSDMTDMMNKLLEKGLGASVE